MYNMTAAVIVRNLSVSNTVMIYSKKLTFEVLMEIHAYLNNFLTENTTHPPNGEPMLG